MSDPLSFPSVTPRYGLPLLFAGQAQKDAFVNGAHALVDMLIQPAVEGEAAAPSDQAEEGHCWIVSDAPTGAFAGHPGEIACRSAGTWIFCPPRDGMRVYDKASGQLVPFVSGWRRQAAPAIAEGGSTIDAEARAALESVILALQQTGILELS